MIIISHRLSMLSNCAKILVMDEGRFFDLGTHDELMARCLIYRDMWLRQNKHLLVQKDKSLQVAQ
jgi:ATP-binding cassette subfamily B protein